MPALARLVIVMILPLLLVPVTRADSVSDTAKEQRWANQITDQLIVGEPIWLEADGHRFLAIYTPAETASPRGTALLVHGIGAHPDWPQVIQPLRSGLSEQGWQSLSCRCRCLRRGSTRRDKWRCCARAATDFSPRSPGWKARA